MIKTIRAGAEPLEHDCQVAFFDYLRAQPPLNGLRIEDYAWANPNGMYLGRGSIAQKAAYISKMKRAGFKVGVSDTTIAIPLFDLHGFYLELKRKMSRAEGLRAVSDDQKKFLCDMWNAGYFAGVALGIEEAIAAFEHFKSGGKDWNLDLFAERCDGLVAPLPSKRKRTR